MNKLYYASFLFLSLFSSCKKDKQNAISPEIVTSINVSAAGADYTGEIQNIPLDNIKQVGFIWSKNPEPVTGGKDVFSYTEKNVSLNFDFKISTGLIKDSTYYVKAYYIDNSDVYHYAQQQSFKSISGNQLTIDFLQSSFTWGDEVKLTLDTTVTNNLNDITITINQTLVLKPSKIDSKSVFFNVPASLQNHNNSLVVTIYGQQSNSINLTITPPVITDGGSTAITYGELFTIKGQFFNPAAASNKVVVGTTNLEVISATTTQLTVKLTNLPISIKGNLTVKTGIDIQTTTETEYSLYRFLQPKGNFPGVARTIPITLAIDGNIYCGLGEAKDGHALKDWWKYEPASDKWTRMADFPQTAYFVSGFSIGKKAYVGLGTIGGNFTNAFYAYDATTNQWQTIASFPGYYTANSVSFSSNKYGYIVGGDQSRGAIIRVNDAWRYNPSSDSWTKTSSFPGTARSHAMQFTMNNKGYVIGGTINSFNPFSNEAWVFDFNTEKWSQIASMPQGAGSIGGFAFSIQNKGYVGGGTINDSSGSDSNVYEYDPSADKWTQKEVIMDAIRSGSGSVSVDNTGYIICGDAYFDLFDVGSQNFFQFKP